MHFFFFLKQRIVTPNIDFVSLGLLLFTTFCCMLNFYVEFHYFSRHRCFIVFICTILRLVQQPFFFFPYSWEENGSKLRTIGPYCDLSSTNRTWVPERDHLPVELETYSAALTYVLSSDDGGSNYIMSNSRAASNYNRAMKLPLHRTSAADKRSRESTHWKLEPIRFPFSGIPGSGQMSAVNPPWLTVWKKEKGHVMYV